jgi:DUF3047 family protein
MSDFVTKATCRALSFLSYFIHMSPIVRAQFKTLALCLALGLSIAATRPAAASNITPAVSEIVVGSFTGEVDPGGLPVGWKPFEFPRKHKLTEYSVRKEGGNCFIKAVSDCSASAIYKEVGADLSEFPYLTWRWKVDGVLKNGDETRKDGDDFSARVYVTFEEEPGKASYLDRLKRGFLKAFLGKKMPGKAISYVWANRLAKNEAVLSPFTDSVMTVAVESGDALAGQWILEERNVYDDYRALFKSEPPKVMGVVIMTDSDNTKESATGYYADIVFKRSPLGLDSLHTQRIKQ